MMTPSDRLSKMMTTTALLAALGLPLAACAETTASAVEAPAQSTTVSANVTHTTQADEAVAMAEEVEVEAEEVLSPEEAEKKAIEDEIAALQLEARINSARLTAELAPLQEEKSRLEAEVAILRARQSAGQLQQTLDNEQAAFDQQVALADAQRAVAEMQAQVQMLSAQQALASAELAAVQTRDNYNAVNRDAIEYPMDPMVDGVLTISDRRIPLNGAIGGGMADYITQRINYFNNLNSEAPMFIVIDGSPGGSVMEGFRIVQAMQNSQAPVYVVVKSYAASMAATICTLSEKSYVYPNSLILHHQMSSGMSGNLTQQRESLEEGYEWAERLADPIAEKMGVTPEEFTELMYENNSDGDWGEFGDVAVELKWADYVVTEIRETAITVAPGSAASREIYAQADGAPSAGLSQHDLFNAPIQYEVKTDGNGRSYVELPRLAPMDFYFLSDSDNYYREAE